MPRVDGARAELLFDPKELVVLLDALAPAGLELAAGVEVAMGPGARLFLEYTPALYSAPYPSLLRAALESSGPGWAVFSGSALNALSFRYGVRWLL